MTDEELLKEASRGDEAAFLELHERHRNALFGFAYRMLGSVELAEDVTQECFLSLIRQPLGFDASRASLRTYLYGATRNLAMKHFRRTHQEVAIEELLTEPIMPDAAQPLHQLLDEEMALMVQRAVRHLAPLQREALVLFEYEELSLAEIAQIVGADLGTVKARLYRARRALRRSLSPYCVGSTEVVLMEEALR